jgi:hypothetical protein
VKTTKADFDWESSTDSHENKIISMSPVRKLEGAVVSEKAPAENQILCPYCKRLITLPAISLGSKEKCPHCDIEFVVSSRQIPQPSEDKDAAIDGGYGLQTKIPVSGGVNELPPGKKIPQSETELSAEKPRWRPMATPPVDLFLSRTFTFPFRAGSRVCFIVQAVSTFLVLAVGYQAWYCSGFSGSGPTLFLSALFTGIAFVLLLIWFFTISAYSLTILREASEGVQDFKGMASGIFLDMFEEAFYMLISIFWGGLPGWVIVLLVPGLGSAKPLVIVPLAMILYPLFLLSMLENNSVSVPYSKPVWRSLWYAWHSWVLFYLLTLLVGETLVYLLRLIPFKDIGPLPEMIFLSIVMPFFLMVYFRLLGRLTWFCSGRFEEQAKRRALGYRV